MVISQRTATSGTAASGAGFSVTLPTGFAVGDLIVVAITNATTTGPAAPTGWTRAYSASAGSAQCHSVYWAPYSAGLTLAFTNVAAIAAWVCNAFFEAGKTIVLDGAPVAATSTGNNANMVTGAPTTGPTAGDYEVLTYGWTSSATQTAASGMTVDKQQANGTTCSVSMGHNNTASLPASTACTAFAPTLSASNTRKTGVGVLLMAQLPRATSQAGSLGTQVDLRQTPERRTGSVQAQADLLPVFTQQRQAASLGLKVDIMVPVGVQIGEIALVVDLAATPNVHLGALALMADLKVMTSPEPKHLVSWPGPTQAFEVVEPLVITGSRGDIMNMLNQLVTILGLQGVTSDETIITDDVHFPGDVTIDGVLTAPGFEGGGGSEWFTGPAPPVDTLGESGDMYLEGDGDIWHRNGTWTQTTTNIKGAAGAAGAQGAQGPAGPAGADSTVPGPQGPQGPAGTPGAQGPQGATGPTGPTGPTGADGLPGMQGPKGDTGAQGPQGPAGPSGPAGAQGIQGPAGATGPQGPDGDTGPQGPQGIQGPIGPQGIQGPMGPQADGFEFKGSVMNEASLPTQPQPPNDAYIVQSPAPAHLWVSDGNVWIDMGQFQGPEGPQGPIGIQGEQGPTGATGPQGPVGPAGPSGQTGMQGPVGPAGPAGPQGPAGDPFGTPVLAIGSMVHWRPFDMATRTYGLCKPAVVLGLWNDVHSLVSVHVLGTQGGPVVLMDEVPTGDGPGQWHFIVDCPFSQMLNQSRPYNGQTLHVGVRPHLVVGATP